MIEFAVYNPHEKPVDQLPVIYGFNNGGAHGWMHAQLIAEDGTALGSHICSDEFYMYGDLGIYADSRPDRHETFREHYPDGYRMDFVPSDKMFGHEGLDRAIKLNQEKAKDEDTSVQVETTEEEK